MGTNVTLNGSTYTIPASGESNWGTNVSNYLIAIASSCLQKTGGSFTLTGEIDFGATYGLKSAYFKSRATNPSSTGVVRLGNNEGISWRNAANNADLIMKLNTDDDLEYNGSLRIGDAGTEGAGIDIGGVTYNSSLKISDINGSNYAQTILHRHSTTLEPVIVGARSNSNTSSHAAVTNGMNLFSVYGVGSAGSNYKIFSSMTFGASASGTISNTSAPGAIKLYTTPDTSLIPGLALLIDQDKKATFYGVVNLDAITANRALVSGSGKNIEVSATTAAELAYLSGVTSSVQTQLDAKIPKSLVTTSGDLIYATGASTPARLPLGSESQVLKVVAGAPTWANFSGGINYITATDGTSIGAWTTYADAAASTPVDGTGGLPTVTYAISTDSSLRGTSNFLWTHGASNQQGQGFSYNFSIDPSDKGKVLQCSVEYLVSSGTYADDDLQFWIYDVTNAALIQPAPYKLKNSSIIEKFAFEFQTSSSSTSYRLIGHVATSTATAYTIRFDNFNVGPQAKLYGSNITDLVDWTPTVTGLGTVTINRAKWKQVGDEIEGEIRVIGGTATGATVTFTTPSGVALDYSATQYLGTGSTTNTTNPDVQVMWDSSGATNLITLFNTIGGTSGFSALTGTALGNSVVVSLKFRAKVVGWSSSVVKSSDADTRVNSLSATRITSSQTAVAGTPLEIVFNNIDTNGDTHGQFSTSTGRFTAGTPGWYRFSSVVSVTMGATAPASVWVRVLKNSVVGVAYGPDYTDSLANSKSYTFKVNDKIYLNAGDYISVWVTAVTQNITVNFSNNNRDTSFTVERISGPAQIAASESYQNRYTSNAANNITNGAYNFIDFEDKDFDSHGSVSGTGSGNVTTTNTGWKFTANTSGVYSVNSVVGISFPTSTTIYMFMTIYVNGTAVSYGNRVSGTTASTSAVVNVSISDDIRLLSGDRVEIAVYQESTATRAMSGVSGANRVSIKRVGNY